MPPLVLLGEVGNVLALGEGGDASRLPQDALQGRLHPLHGIRPVGSIGPEIYATPLWA